MCLGRGSPKSLRPQVQVESSLPSRALNHNRNKNTFYDIAKFKLYLFTTQLYRNQYKESFNLKMCPSYKKTQRLNNLRAVNKKGDNKRNTTTTK